MRQPATTIIEGDITGESPNIANIRTALSQANSDQSKIDPAILQIQGMSGRRYRRFINNLVGLQDDARYLEVGSWAGSTLCSAINGNLVKATAIDNWSEFGGPKDMFMANLNTFRTDGAAVNVIEKDFREVDYASAGKHNIYLFDGPHSEVDQYDGLALAIPALTDEFIFVVDDWNWEKVRTGTHRAISECRLHLTFSVEIRTSLDDSVPEPAFEKSDWHNGYFVGLLKQ